MATNKRQRRRIKQRNPVVRAHLSRPSRSAGRHIDKRLRVKHKHKEL